MENRINISELLKDCPKGMELDCTMFEGVFFERVDKEGDYPIAIRVGKTDIKHITKEGCWNKYSNAKCVIFPKGKTTWEGFQIPFKDGDIIAEDDGRICIYKNDEKIKNTANYYCGILSSGDFRIKDEKYPTRHFGPIEYYHLATEEERQKLFDAIKANGFRWNSETKTLEKLDDPKFKVGDKCLWNYDTKIPRVISKVELTSTRGYVYWIDCDGCSSGWWSEDELTPIPDKIDITTLKPFDKVLARDTDNSMWTATLFSHLRGMTFYTVSSWYNQCIPFQGNEHLLGTTNDCDEFYKTWE